MRSFFDELLLLVDPFHLLFVLLLDVLSINLDNLRLESFVILNRVIAYTDVILVHVCDIILERFDVIDVVDLVLIELGDFLLHSATF